MPFSCAFYYHLFNAFKPNLMPLNRKCDLSNDFLTQLMPFDRKSDAFQANLMLFSQI